MAPVSPLDTLYTRVRGLIPAVESYCVPNFDSPSIFARILDKDKVRSSVKLDRFSAQCLLSIQGGHFSIAPTAPFTTKQNYLPNSNVSGHLP